MIKSDHGDAAHAHLVVLQECLALGELVVLAEATIEEVTHARVVGQH